MAERTDLHELFLGSVEVPILRVLGCRSIDNHPSLSYASGGAPTWRDDPLDIAPLIRVLTWLDLRKSVLFSLLRFVFGSVLRRNVARAC